MKITVLNENTAIHSQFSAEHGLSLFLETGPHRILFDMGQTSLFSENARRLGIDLKTVDFAVISHGHYDHGGGLQTFLARNSTAPVYISRLAFAPHFSGSEKFIGLDATLRHHPQLVLTDDFLQIADGIELFSCNQNPRPYPTNAFGLTRDSGIGRQPDSFLHEQYLLIHENGKRILFSGCSHKGIRNIVQWIQPDVLIGGFHLNKLNPSGDGRASLTETAQHLLEFPTQYYTCHCTGTEQYAFLKEQMKDRLHSLSCGQVLEL